VCLSPTRRFLQKSDCPPGSSPATPARSPRAISGVLAALISDNGGGLPLSCCAPTRHADEQNFARPARCPDGAPTSAQRRPGAAQLRPRCVREPPTPQRDDARGRRAGGSGRRGASLRPFGLAPEAADSQRTGAVTGVRPPRVPAARDRPFVTLPQSRNMVHPQGRGKAPSGRSRSSSAGAGVVPLIVCRRSKESNESTRAHARGARDERPFPPRKYTGIGACATYRGGML